MSNGSTTKESPPVVLLVDDEKDLLDLLEDFLAGQGYRIHRAAGGKAGIRSIMELHPDAVVTDLMMPDVSGLEVLETARMRHPDVSVLVLTGYATLESSIGALDLGAVGYLLKPIRKSEFNARVRDAVAQTRLRRHRTALLVDFAAASIKFQAVFDAVEHGLILVSGVGTVESVNSAAAGWLGRPADEVVGLSCEDALARMSAELADAITRVQRTREPAFLHECVLSTASGPAVFDTIIGPVESLEGPDGVLVTLTDTASRRGRQR